MKLFREKVICPRCDGNGLIYKAEIKKLNQIVYVCDECDATWLTNNEIYLNNFIDFETFLEENSCSYNDANIIRLGYDWYNK
ncbi:MULTISPECIES: 3'-5' exonuclease [Bacillus]|nr:MULTISPECIES: 3'-5' exonuclease [Bacillus]PFV83110.1 3'-5' exonuclease [Bacillus sp. AFS059628]PGQ44870.1 3'-5' exonuclease [Bacillus thuringiensis]PGV68256.1 3'-5' exonuclease [Bacillus cereus]